MRVFFIGIHNKPGLPPLCSSTKSGKVIDAIISKIDASVKIVKCNLFDTDHVPDKNEITAHCLHWNNCYEPSPNDIFIILGARVKHYLKPNTFTVLLVKHPSCPMTLHDKLKYIETISSFINFNS